MEKWPRFVWLSFFTRNNVNNVYELRLYTLYVVKYYSWNIALFDLPSIKHKWDAIWFRNEVATVALDLNILIRSEKNTRKKCCFIDRNSNIKYQF